ncbi:hypothetical protein NC652_018439 [Populus alba x Populus x berolinensis]|nr:hypothetical protein NC652_018439 [Populus alba x Populus x berolinensis]
MVCFTSPALFFCSYGSFFGPSQPVISQRVIQESKSIIENQHLALRVPNAQHTNKKSSSSTATGLKNRVHGLVPKVKNEVKTKVQKLKDTRDYSFLLTDDAELPAPTKEPAPRNVSAPNSGNLYRFFADVQEARSAQVPQKIKQASSNSGRNIHGIREERKPVFRNGQMHPKVGSQKPSSANKPDATSINSRRQLGSNNGTGPGRPAGPKFLPSKTPASIMQKKASSPSAKKILPAMHKSLPSNPSKSSIPKQHWEQRKGLQEPNKARPIPKQPLSSLKSQIHKPIKQVSSHASLQDNRPKKKPVRPFPDAGSDDEDAFSMLRKLIGNKNRGNFDDDDDSDMEANFDDIMKEERRSARIAREEDEEQLRLIEEEERRERERKLAKKRKLAAARIVTMEETLMAYLKKRRKRNIMTHILYLNKLRLVAVEELNKANREKQLLLDKIQQLGAVNKLGNEQSLWRELLLRIDSMVLTGLIDSAEASGMRKAVMGNKNGFHIIQICTEMEPLVSVGSLSSYVTGLSKALQKKGHMVEVILPKYACLDLTEMQGLREIEAELYSYFNGQLHGNRIWTGIVHGIAVTLIQPLYYSSFFDRERVYGYSDDFERFTYFSRASLDYIAKSGKQPDVLHIHNWETAIVGPLFWDIFVKQGLGGTRVLLTCHGFDSQCLEQPDKLALCGLDPARLHRPDRLQDHTMTHLVNILKGGLVYSNKVVMVQSIYSKERIINSFGHGLEPTLAIHKDKLLVSPCGFDNSTWDPSKDKFLPKNYSADDLKGKSICKVALQQQLGLSKNSSTVLVGCICTESLDFDLNNQKAVWNATQKSVQDETVRFINKYDEALLHLIFAGSDIILCQSFHDPLLQVPLKALKYGAAPVAVTSNENKFRHFVDHEQETSRFSRFISSTFGYLSLSQAVDEIKNSPSKWKQKIVDAMAKDFSWNAECYDVHVSAYTALKSL